MIPPFNEFGYLPLGVHPATLGEINARFGQISELRRVQMESVRWMVELAEKAGVHRIVLNGSFTTDIMDPGDVDCVLLAGDDASDLAAEEELLTGLPFLEILLVGTVEFDELVNIMFASDRDCIVKGMIEIISWR